METVEELIFLKEQIKQEGASYQRRYYHQYGPLLLEIAQLKNEILVLKKVLRFIQKKINQGQQTTLKQIEAFEEVSTQAIQDSLLSLQEQVEATQMLQEVPVEVVKEVKKKYRALAKRLHPDMYPETKESPTLQLLWNQIQEAYQNFEVEQLEELEQVIDQILECPLEKDVDQEKALIQKLKIQIDDLFIQYPYLYKDLIDNPEHLEQLQNERSETMAYRDKLKQEKENYVQRIESN